LDAIGEIDRVGRYMQPIRYLKHCQDCHPMWRSVQDLAGDESLQAAAKILRSKPLPHPGPGQDASVTIGAMRAVYYQFVTDHPESIIPQSKQGDVVRPLPGKSETAEPGRREQWEWVNTQMAAVERALSKSGGCYQCHEAPQGQSQTTLAVKPPNIPRRWLPKSVFSHAMHTILDCQACHKDAQTSVTHSDVLLPAINSCVECHSRLQGVRSDCLTCHGYHPLEKKRAFVGKMSIEEFLQK
jgi:hypothetical protein